MTVERHDRALDVGGTTLTYTVAGARGRPPLCFIPGWCGHRSFFAAQIDHFADRNFVIAVDFPGFGDSRPAPGWADATTAGHDLMSRASRLVRAVLAHEDVRDCWLAGHSAGGALALTAAAGDPGLARGVIGIDSLTYPDFYPRLDDGIVDAIAGPLEADFVGSARAVAETWFLPGADPALKRRIVEATVAADARTAVAALRAFLRWDMMHYLAAYDGPVGAIVAAHFYDAAAASALLGDRVAVRPLPGVGHFLMMEQPEPFNRALEGLIRGCA